MGLRLLSSLTWFDLGTGTIFDNFHVAGRLGRCDLSIGAQ